MVDPLVVKDSCLMGSPIFSQKVAERLPASLREGAGGPIPLIRLWGLWVPKAFYRISVMLLHFCRLGIARIWESQAWKSGTFLGQLSQDTKRACQLFRHRFFLKTREAKSRKSIFEGCNFQKESSKRKLKKKAPRGPTLEDAQKGNR